MSSASSLIPNYSFSVMFDLFKFGFSKVSNISGTAEIETIVNGGHNDAPVILRKPKRNPDMLVFERGLHVSTILNKIENTEKTKNGLSHSINKP